MKTNAYLKRLSKNSRKRAEIISVGLISAFLFCWAREVNAQSLKVITFNLRYASAADGDNNWSNANQSPARREVAAQVLIDHAPDLVGFQEGEEAQLTDLQSLLPSHYALFWEKPSGGGGNERAAIAYNKNTVFKGAHGVFSLGNSPGGSYWDNVIGTPYDPWDLFPENAFAFPRIVLWSEFTLIGQPEKKLVFHTTHFDTFNGANNGESQVKSAELLFRNTLGQAYGVLPRPYAVAVGDFNSSQVDRAWRFLTGSYMYNGLMGDYGDAWLDANGNWTDSGTFHGFSGGVISEASRIDWILYRGGLTVSDVEIVYDHATATVTNPPGTRMQYPSDHYPVKATVWFPTSAPPDFDKDGIPDAIEIASPLLSPVDMDSDFDLLIDSLEDVNRNGQVDPGESNPSIPDAVVPRYVQKYRMDGLPDFPGRVGVNGVNLWVGYDGRFLYVACEDPGEGNDHFIFVTFLTLGTPSNTSAPWAKAGQVLDYSYFLGAENDGDFIGWFDSSGNILTNDFSVIDKTRYYDNSGVMEGVLDTWYINPYGILITAAAYPTADGSALIPSSQSQQTDGDGNITNLVEYYYIPSDDSDPRNATPDWVELVNIHGSMPNEWEDRYLLSGWPLADADMDGLTDIEEWWAGTDPSDATSCLEITNLTFQAGTAQMEWNALYGKSYRVLSQGGPTLSSNAWVPGPWASQTNTFPTSTMQMGDAGGSTHMYYRIEVKSK